MGHRKSTISAVTCAVLLAAASSASAHGPMRQGSMMGGGWGMHPGMMGHGMMPCMMMHPGMMQHGMMGPGMMVGPGMMGMMGPGMGAHGMMGPGMMGGQGMMGQGMGHGMMGPQAETGDGLTVDQAKANLGRWLAMLGNPRLKIGAVKEEDENTIVADIVTQDGALVDRFRIDRHTGFMQRIQ